MNIPSMTIVGTYRDGGTARAIDEAGQEYWLNSRADSTTIGRVFLSYPTDEAQPIEDPGDILAAAIALAAWRKRWEKTPKRV